MQNCLLLISSHGGGFSRKIKRGEVKVFSWIYHGKNKKQCYYKPECLVCYVKLFFKLLKLREDKGDGENDGLPLNKAAWLQEISVWKHQIEELLKDG